MMSLEEQEEAIPGSFEPTDETEISLPEERESSALGLLKKLGWIVLADLLLLWAWISGGRVDVSASLVVVLVIPLLAVLNLLAAWFTFDHSKSLSKALIINALIAPVIYFSLFEYEVGRQRESRYRNYYYTTAGRHYSLTILLQHGRYIPGGEFEISWRGPGSSGPTGIQGTYSVRGDTIFLRSDSNRVYRVAGKVLLDFPAPGKRTAVTRHWSPVR